MFMQFSDRDQTEKKRGEGSYFPKIFPQVANLAVSASSEVLGFKAPVQTDTTLTNNRVRV